MNAEQKIIARLTEGSATRQELAETLGCSRRSITPLISRLRRQDFTIAVTSGTEVRNPRYALMSGPGSLGASFVCPSCKITIRLGIVEDHKPDCSFGPKALAEMKETSNGRHW